MTYQEERRNFINAGRPLKQKKPYRIKPISDKRAAKIAAEKEVRGEDETDLQKWFNARRKELTGTCQCGCGNKSSKNDDVNFRSSCCHIFPQAIFESVKLHPMNCVERAVFGGCHSNMDNRGMDRWPNMEDWEDIKEKFHLLAPLLTDQERANKFYANLEKLIYAAN